MHDSVMTQLARTDIFISVAAVADYRVSNPDPHKKKKTKAGLSLEFTENPDILESVATQKNAPFCVGFAAESQDLESYGSAKRLRKNIPLLAANLVQDALGSEDNELVLIDDEGVHRLARSSKLHQARSLIKHITKLYKPSGKSVTTR